MLNSWTTCLASWKKSMLKCCRTRNIKSTMNSKHSILPLILTIK